ncbi:putative reverse transcriptase, RNA-dependent DNA polymerase [Tanacetum coccineum]|uniref:Reverse transcriptase, RNA-dependent DNA polymerase n=1 Tax=Tanacetum coccineum TaxID=301880 RepID=A0ABQ5F8E8_9ASTR
MIFTDGTKEITFKTPYKDPERSGLSSEGHDLLSSKIILSEDDYDKGCRKPSDLEDGFYRDTIKLGPKYVTGKEDEGEVTEINYDKTYNKPSSRPTNLKDKFEQCLKESGERQEIQNEWMKKIMISTDVSLKNLDSSIKRNHFMSNALADLGASISVMPYSLFKILGLGSLKPIKMTIKMVDRSMQSPKGIKENVLVKISKFMFLVDFIILKIMEDENISIILGRPILATAHTKIDVYGKKISLGVGQDQIVFKISKKESHASISPIFVINEFDKMQEFDNLVMNDKKKGDFERYLSPEYGSQDIIYLSKLAKINKDSSMTLCDSDKRMSIGLEDFVDIDDMWDDLDLEILTNEKAKTGFLKSDEKGLTKVLFGCPFKEQIGTGLKEHFGLKSFSKQDMKREFCKLGKRLKDSTELPSLGNEYKNDQED